MITVSNLIYTYPRQKLAAVDGISFTVKQGEIFGFLGPSGAGKSTTQKILIRLLRGYQGQVHVNDTELRLLNQEFYNQVGVGFELPNHYPRLTALENLKFFASFYKNRNNSLMELLETVGLEKDANKPTSEFSKGMKMRLNFVRALVHDPEIIFLDEPTSGLDPVNARKLKTIILNLRSQGKTIFLTTHNMHDADELCDQVAFITQGKIVVTDNPKNLKLAYGTRKLTVEFGNGKWISKEFELDKLGDNTEFLSIIKNEYIRSMHSSEATLEDIFIKTTGQSLS